MKIDDKKKLAIFVAALGISRGMLYSVRNGDYKQEDIDAILAAISPSNLAQVFEVSEEEFQIDYSEYITSDEMDKLRVTTT
jgi:prenyltransferase beta subunit